MQEVSLGAGEDHAALLRLEPELLHLSPENAAQHHDQHHEPDAISTDVTGVIGDVAEVLVNEPGTERNRYR